jgi:3-hydroxyacyl-CoA dehydrogenase
MTVNLQPTSQQTMSSQNEKPNEATMQTKPMSIKKVAVIGAGTMGSSIAAALIAQNLKVVLKDVDDQTLYQGLMKVDRILESRVKKGLALKDAQQQRALVEAAVELSQHKDVDLVIEAVSEKLELKKAVFAELDAILDEHTIFATNTSSLSISQLAANTKRPEKFIGLHFFNPAHLMKLVEVIPGLQTSEETVNVALDFGRSLGKLAIRVEECASFLVNRLLGRYMNEALWCLQEGVASIEAIDKAACDYVAPIGPLALRDMNGADIGLAVANFNFGEYGERFAPAPILAEMVKQNLLGQKTGEGFYLYDAETKKRTQANPKIETIIANLPKAASSGQEFTAERLFLPMINEAFLCLQEKIAKAEDIDAAIMAGLGMRKGPLALAADMGLANCLQSMEAHFAKYGERFRPAPLLKRYVWAKRESVL